MTTWHQILTTLYPELAAVSRRFASQQSIPQGNRLLLAEEALQDACQFLLRSARDPAQLTDCRAYAITTVKNAMRRLSRRERRVRKVSLEDTTMPTLAPRSSPSGAMEATETLMTARKAAGERLWLLMASLLDNPTVSASEDAQWLGTTPGTIRGMRHEARQRIGYALRSEPA